MANIDQVSIPDKEIEEIFQLLNTLPPIKEQLNLLDVISKISNWLESIHVSVFTLEKNVKNQLSTRNTDYSTQHFEAAMLQIDPIIQLLPELCEVIEHKYNLNNDRLQSEYIKKITKLQSEWSSLQHFLCSVKKLLLNQRESKKLLDVIEQLIFQIDDISVLIFDFQEKKQYAFALPTSSSLSESSSTDNTTIISNATEEFNKEDLMINEIDHCYEPILRQMEYLFQKITTVNDPLIVSRFHKLKERWEVLQYERDELKSEQKEDRWLTVFRRVADQVDSMIDGLNKSIVQCKYFIRQLQTISTAKEEFDEEKFKSVEKTFEAKYKYYTPSIDKMLLMLGNGIAVRAAKDNQTFLRHGSMLQKWHQMKEVMENLRMTELIKAERILNSAAYKNSVANFNNMSPLPTNTHADKRNLRLRTPEPTVAKHNRFSNNSTKTDRMRSATPNSLYDRRNSLGKSQPLASQQHSPQLHENTSDSLSSTSTIKVVSRTPKPTKSIITKKSIDFYEQDENDFGLDMSNLTKRNNKTKDETMSLRARSSLGHLYKRDNATMIPSISTNRRSMTPSLIPRPKTPSKQHITQMPRPKSYQQQRAASQLGIAPPVPALPKSIPRRQSFQEKDNSIYIPDSRDALDVELSKIINSSPIQIQCQRASAGRYYFGSESSISINGGKKLYACKLMTYTDRKRKGNGQNKVLIRVGGGWQDLEFFLLEHSSFMSANDIVTPPVKKKFTANLLNYWKN